MNTELKSGITLETQSEVRTNKTDLQPETIKRRIPAHWTEHWSKNGNPTGAWYDAKSKPIKDFLLSQEFFVVYRPEQEIEETLLPAKIERLRGWSISIKEIDLSKFLPLGSRLSWRQRFKGAA